MIVYRIHKAQYDALDGTGAALFGRRWNKRGTPVVYVSTSLALCRAEVGVNTSVGDLPGDYLVSEIEIDERLTVGEIPLNRESEDWKKTPFPRQYQQLGNDTLKKYPVFRVPSTKDPKSDNMVINPFHPEVKKHVRVVKQYPL